MRGRLAVLALLVSFSTATLGANNITGLVRNQSRGGPAAGDEVILVRLDGAMQVEARAKTDAHGSFTLNVQYPEKAYLVRVFHQGVSYDQRTRRPRNPVSTSTVCSENPRVRRLGSDCTFQSEPDDISALEIHVVSQPAATSNTALPNQ
jgi:hypothetical protein